MSHDTSGTQPPASDDPARAKGADDGDTAAPGASDEMIALALAAGSTVVDTSKKLGVSQPTIYRRLRSPAFRTLLSERQAELVSGAMSIYVGAMTDGMRSAVAKIRDLIENGSTHTIQLNAAKSFVELSLRVRDQMVIAAQIEELKELVGGNPANRTEGTQY